MQGSMLITLTEFFKVVAKSKGIKDIDEWVSNRLSHCQIDSEYSSNIHLKSSKKMRFGVQDAKFHTNSFILYKESINNDDSPFKEFEVFTFKSLEGNPFRQQVYDSYHLYYDSTKDFRLYFMMTPVDLEICSQGVPCKLGSFNDMELNTFEVVCDLYDVQLTLGNETMHEYFMSEALMLIYLQKLYEVKEAVKIIYKGEAVPLHYDRTEEGQLICSIGELPTP